jgi:hypothetical protein
MAVNIPNSPLEITLKLLKRSGDKDHIVFVVTVLEASSAGK